MIPIILLVLDIIAYPIFIETRDASESFSGEQLIKSGSAFIGNFKAHRICVCLDDISDSDYLRFLNRNAESGHRLWSHGHRDGNALVLSIVQVEGGWSSSLLNSVLRKVDSVSGVDRDGITDVLMQAEAVPSNVLWYDFQHVGSSNHEGFPLNHLLLVKLSEQKKEGFPGKMAEVLNLVEAEDVSNLVLPCLGRNPQARNKEWLSCDDTFAALFQGLKRGGSPRTVYLSLYKRWSDAAIAEAAESLKDRWKSTLESEQAAAGALPIVYQSDARLLLFFLSVCLLVCSFRVEVSLKSFVIICLLFVPAALELQEKVPPLLRDVTEAMPVWVIKAVLLLLLSSGFLFFADLDVEGFLKTHGDKPKT